MTDALTLEQQRILAGLCTRCGKPGREDANLCLACTSSAAERNRTMRKERRARGQCACCGRRSETYRCRRCEQKKRRARVGVTGTRVGDYQPPPQIVAKVEADSKYGTRVRQRYVGRGARGAPSREQLAADRARDVRFAIREAEKLAARLAVAISPEVDALPPVQREAYYHEALGPLGLAMRLLEDVEDFLKARIARGNR